MEVRTGIVTVVVGVEVVSELQVQDPQKIQVVEFDERCVRHVTRIRTRCAWPLSEVLKKWSSGPAPALGASNAIRKVELVSIHFALEKPKHYENNDSVIQGI